MLSSMSMTTTQAVQTGFARLEGTFTNPRIVVHVNPAIPYPADRSMSMLDWVKSHGRSVWDANQRAWTIFGVSSHTPSQALAQAGIDLLWDERPEQFANLDSVDELATPIGKLAENGRTVLVRHRLVGYELCQQLLGDGAVWDRERGLFLHYVGDVITPDGTPLPGVHWPADAIEEATRLHHAYPVRPELIPAAATLGAALDTTGIRDDALSAIGELPGGARELFSYQEAGAYAVTAGRVCLFDEPGVGKTAQAATSARMLKSERTLIVCPPLLTTNWAREAALAGLVADVENATVIRSGRKEPNLPREGTVIVPDSLLASRPALQRKIIDWGVEVMIVDEAHRLKTIGSKRSEAVLDVGAHVEHPPIALTGTPILGSPHELVPLLELTRMLCPVFGGRSMFLRDFCRKDRFGGWHARKSALPRLHKLLRDYVWVRRRKRDVLPQLPQKVRGQLPVDVPMKAYRDAHKDVIQKIHAWISWWADRHDGQKPTTADMEQFAVESSFELVSQLRHAAGLAKITAAAEVITDHVESTGYDMENGVRVWRRPLIVWTHHIEVAAALTQTLPDGQVAAIVGGTTDNERDSIVDAFQQGRIPVLIAAITKAGVGLTLTRSSDALFVETSWVPAEIIQAEDRQHRIGATHPVLYTTLVARNTLDEPIQRVLNKKTTVLEKAIGNTDDSVAVLEDTDAATLTDIAMTVIDEALASWKPGKGTTNG